MQQAHDALAAVATTLRTPPRGGMSLEGQRAIATSCNHHDGSCSTTADLQLDACDQSAPTGVNMTQPDASEVKISGNAQVVPSRSAKAWRLQMANSGSDLASSTTHNVVSDCAPSRRLLRPLALQDVLAARRSM
jgi:hypothetical protein